MIEFFDQSSPNGSAELSGLGSDRPAAAPVYRSRATFNRLTPLARLWAAAIAAACMAVLLVAARLPPNPRGMATHTRLGLAECDFLRRTGIPCPSCGMTTSFSWMVRGNLAASAYVQPMGAALALLTGCTFWAAAYAAATGRPAHRLLWLIPSKAWAAPLFTLALLAWAWKIFIHLNSLDGWR